MAYIIYFIVGFVVDVIITLYTIQIIKRKAFWAGFLAFIITLLNLFVYEHILPSEKFVFYAVSFALGCFVGTTFTIKWKR